MCNHSYTFCTLINPEPSSAMCLSLFCFFAVDQVSACVATGCMFWTLERVTGTFPSPGVGGLIIDEPVTQTVTAGFHKIDRYHGLKYSYSSFLLLYEPAYQLWHGDLLAVLWTCAAGTVPLWSSFWQRQTAEDPQPWRCHPHRTAPHQSACKHPVHGWNWRRGCLKKKKKFLLSYLG